MPEINRLYEIFLAHPAVCTDSRKVVEGSFFFALKGDNFDGNAYAADAIESGAAYAVVDDGEAAVSDRYVLVGNVLEALQKLANFHRRKLGIPILAITGSNGKTTTKELVSRVLGRKFNVSVTRGNLNNHIGVPLTLLSMTEKTELGVVEMGANHQGEIAMLCSIAEPDYGLVTNIGKCHLEGFGGIEGVTKGKGELFDRLGKTGGTAFIAEDNAEIKAMAHERPNMKTVSYSAENLRIIPSRDNLLKLKTGDREIKTNLIGDYNRFNIAAALAIGTFFGIPEEDSIQAVEGYIPDNARSQRKASGSNILYLDYYNANPTSMKAAIENFAAADESGLKKALILGDMGELGKYAEKEHLSTVENIKRLGFSEVYLVGGIFKNAAQGENFKTFGNVSELCEYLKAHPVNSRMILIKGSRSAHLEKTEPFLLQLV